MRHPSRIASTNTPSSPSSETSSPAAAEKQDRPAEPDIQAYASGYQTIFQELPFRACDASSVPDDLKGTYFRTGPAMFSAGSIPPPRTSIVQPKQGPVLDGQDPNRMVLHPFEGDGAVLAVTFSDHDNDDGLEDEQSDGNGAEEGAEAATEAATEPTTSKKKQVSARYRLIRTVGFTSERKKGAKLYEGMDSTRNSGMGSLGNDLPLPLYRHHLMPGLNKKRKHTANTRAVYWGKRLFCLWEGGQPYKMDALSLQTEGKSRLGGAIPKEVDPFGCKMVYDAAKDHVLFHAVDIGAKKSQLTLYEFNSDFELVHDPIQTDLPGVALVHDFAATSDYAIFIQPSLKVDSMKFMVSKDPGSVLQLDEEPAVLHLIPREGDGETRSIEIPRDEISDANLQYINAFQTGSEVTVDVIRSDTRFMSPSNLRWPWGKSTQEYSSAASRKSLWRYTIDLQRKTVSKTRLFDGHCMFGVTNPAVSGRQHENIYMCAGALGEVASPPQGIVAFNCQSGETSRWFPEPHEFCGEPMYAPREGNTQSSTEDNGYLLSVLYNGAKKESELLVFEAQNVSQGPVSRISLGITIPHGYYGCFTGSTEARWGAAELQRRAKLSDKMESRGNMWNEVKSDFSGLGLRFDDFEEYFGMDMNDFFTLPKDRK